ncbi:MAG: tetratricopeptide repeat protein [Kiritimatiellales bacterium]|nr:tetratricopeptide repeat protein [Kiritimatiellales bacterium]
MRQIFLHILIAGMLLAGTATVRAQNPAPAADPSVLVKIDAALNDGFYQIAEQQVAAFLATSPPDAERHKAALLMAHALWGQQRHDDTLKLLASYGYEPGFIYWRARSLYELGRYAEGFKLLNENDAKLAASKYASVALRLKGHIQLKAGQLDAAEKSFAEFAKKYPKSAEATENALDLADIYQRRNKTTDAVKVLKGVVGGSDKEAAQKAKWQLGHLLSEQIDPKSRKDALAVLTELATNDQARLAYRIDAWVDIAALEEKSGRVPEAIEALQKAAKLTLDAGQRVRLKIAQARLLFSSGDAAAAMRLLEECRNAAPNEKIAAEVQLEKAGVLLKTKDYTAADEAYQVYLDVSSDEAGMAQAYYGKGLCLWELKRYAEAAAAFDKAVKGLPDPAEKADAFFKAGDAYYATGQFEEALKRYRAVWSGLPGSARVPNALYQIGASLLKLEKTEEALTTFQLLETRFPNSTFSEKAAMRVADVLLEAEDWEKALEQYTHIGQTYTNGPMAALTRHQSGLLLYRLGRYQEAQRTFESVVKDYPDSKDVPQASYMRGFCLYLQGQVQEAVKTCQEFIRKYPDSAWTPEVLFWLAEQSYNDGKYDKAEPLFLRIVKDYKTHLLAPRALYWAGRSAAAQASFVKAIEHYSAVAKQFPDSDILPQTRFAQGDALSELGEFARAILAFEEIIKNYPDSYLVNSAWGRKGDCQFSLAAANEPGRYNEAVRSYQAILDRPSAPAALKLQAEYKLGRCLEKTDQTDKAFAHCMNVVYTFLGENIERSPDSVLWFTRAAFSAAAIKEKVKAWKDAVQVYGRVVEAQVPAKEEAARRIENIRKENWLLFQKSEEIKNAGTDG